MYLPAGNFSLAARVFNAYGTAATVVATDVIVGFGGDSGADIDVDVLQRQADRLLGQGSLGAALALIDSVAASLNLESTAQKSSSRRLTSSTVAYRTRVRRMLFSIFQRSSRVHQVIALTSTAVLRAALRAAAVPAEVEPGSAITAIRQLISALGAMDLRRVRATMTLPDAVGLVGHVIAAATPHKTGEELAALAADAADALLAMAQLYVQGMVATEAAITVSTSANVRLEIAPYGPTASGLSVSVSLPLAGNISMLSRKHRATESTTAVAAEPVGVVVLRLKTSAGSRTAPYRNVNLVTADIVGVRIATFATSPAVVAVKSGGVWDCPHSEAGVWPAATASTETCVGFDVATRWARLAEDTAPSSTAHYTCQRWDGKAWAGGRCTLARIVGGNASMSSCICNSDGIFTVSVALLANKMDQASPVCLLRFQNPAGIGASVTCGTLLVFLVTFIIVSLCLTSTWIGVADKLWHPQQLAMFANKKVIRDSACHGVDNAGFTACLSGLGFAWLAGSGINSYIAHDSASLADTVIVCALESSGYASWLAPAPGVAASVSTAFVGAAEPASLYPAPVRIQTVVAARGEDFNPSISNCVRHTPSLTEQAQSPLLLKTTGLGLRRDAQLAALSLQQALDRTAAAGGVVVVTADFVLEPPPLATARTLQLRRKARRTPSTASLAYRPAQARAEPTEPEVHNPCQDSEYGLCLDCPSEPKNDTLELVPDQDTDDDLWLHRIISVSAIILDDET